MKVVIEILLVAIIVFGTVFGVKKGFIEITAKPVKFIAALILAFNLCASIAEAIIAPMLYNPVVNYISEFMYENCASLTAENAAEELPTLLKIAAAIFNIDIAEAAASGTSTVIDNIIDALTAPVINVIAIIFSFIIVYFLAKLLLTLAIWLVNFLCKGGIIGAVNKILGFVFGALLSVIIAWAVAVLLDLIFHLPAFEGSELIANFEGGFFYRFFNTYNPIELLLSF